MLKNARRATAALFAAALLALGGAAVATAPAAGATVALPTPDGVPCGSCGG